MKKFLAAIALLAILSGDLFADAKKKKQRKCCGKCKPKKPPQACAEKAVDVIFVLDGSSSVGPKNGQLVQNLESKIINILKFFGCSNEHHFFVSSPSRKTLSTELSTSSM